MIQFFFPLRHLAHAYPTLCRKIVDDDNAG